MICRLTRCWVINRARPPAEGEVGSATRRPAQMYDRGERAGSAHEPHGQGDRLPRSAVAEAGACARRRAAGIRHSSRGALNPPQSLRDQCHPHMLGPRDLDQTRRLRSTPSGTSHRGCAIHRRWDSLHRGRSRSVHAGASLSISWTGHAERSSMGITPPSSWILRRSQDVDVAIRFETIFPDGKIDSLIPEIISLFTRKSSLFLAAGYSRVLARTYSGIRAV